MTDALIILLCMVLPQLLPLGIMAWMKERKEMRADAQLREF